MTIDRRTLLVGTAFATTTSILAPILPQSAIAASQALRPANCIVFEIDGWRCGDDDPAGERVVISINRSWRAAWR